MTTPSIGVIVVAAGSGTRLSAGAPKAFVAVGASTILECSLQSVFGMEREASVVVVVPADYVELASDLAARVAGVAASAVAITVGGPTRQASVAAGLAAMPAAVETVLVHDAARALTPAAMFDSVAASVITSGAGVIPVLPVSDTVKRTDAAGRVTGTVDRSELVAVQTPQGFPRAALARAYAEAEAEYTDDAALFAASGGAVSVVAGDPLAFKITTAWDLRRAESLLAPSATAAAPATATEAATAALAPAPATSPVARESRTGVGIDVHAYDDDAPLWLGAVHWPGEPGLAGHSDGDAVSHAICDSLLSAAGLGDIGSRFGTDDPVFAGAHGEVFLTATAALLRDAGWAIGNVSVQVIARRPRMAQRREEIEAVLGAVLDAPVSLSATTTDGLGFTGRGEGVAVIATALVRPVAAPAVDRLDR